MCNDFTPKWIITLLNFWLHWRWHVCTVYFHLSFWVHIHGCWRTLPQSSNTIYESAWTYEEAVGLGSHCLSLHIHARMCGWKLSDDRHLLFLSSVRQHARKAWSQQNTPVSSARKRNVWPGFLLSFLCLGGVKITLWQNVATESPLWHCKPWAEYEVCILSDEHPFFLQKWIDGFAQFLMQFFLTYQMTMCHRDWVIWVMCLTYLWTDTQSLLTIRMMLIQMLFHMFLVCFLCCSGLFEMDNSKLVQRAEVRIFRIQGKTVAEAHAELVCLHGGHALSLSTVHRWFLKFAAGLHDISVKKTGRCLSKLTPAKLAELRNLLDEDNMMCIHVLARHTRLLLRTIHHALHNKMKLKKRPAKWVPHTLSNQQKQRRVQMACDLLHHFRHALTLQDHLVTGDESWFWCYEPEIKRSTSAWLRSNKRRPHKVSKDQYVCKVMLIVFWNVQGVIHKEFVPDGKGVDRHVYLCTMRELWEKLHRRCPQLWRMQSFWLHHDGAPAHQADIVVNFLQADNTKILPHPPYSLDLAPSDFFLFACLKKNMRGITFNSVNELKWQVDFELGQIAQWEFAHATRESWSRRLQQCVDHEGHYFENWLCQFQTFGTILILIF